MNTGQQWMPSFATENCGCRAEMRDDYEIETAAGDTGK